VQDSFWWIWTKFIGHGVQNNVGKMKKVEGEEYIKLSTGTRRRSDNSTGTKVFGGKAFVKKENGVRRILWRGGS